LTDDTSSITFTTKLNAKDTTASIEEHLTTLTTVFNNTRFGSDLNKESKNSHTDAYIAVGIVLGLIALLVPVLLGFRYIKNRSKLNKSYEGSIINAAKATHSTSKNRPDVTETTVSTEEVVNDLYVFADANDSSKTATIIQDTLVYSTPIKKRNPEGKKLINQLGYHLQYAS